MSARRPRLLYQALTYAGLAVTVAVVLYPVLLVCKASLTPGTEVAGPYEAKMAADEFAGCAA